MNFTLFPSMSSTLQYFGGNVVVVVVGVGLVEPGPPLGRIVIRRRGGLVVKGGGVGQFGFSVGANGNLV